MMINQENYQQRPKKINCKPFQKIGQCSLKCHNHSVMFMTNFAPADQNLVPVLFSHFLPISKSRNFEYFKKNCFCSKSHLNFKTCSDCYNLKTFQVDMSGTLRIHCLIIIVITTITILYLSS